MFRVSQHPSSGVLKTVPAASGIGHTTCTATPLLRGPDQTTYDMLPQHLVYKNELNREYVITLARNDESP